MGNHCTSKELWSELQPQAISDYVLTTVLTNHRGNWHKTHFPDIWLLSRKKMYSCICCMCSKNTAFIWSQKAFKALSSVQIWVAACLLSVSKHFRACHHPPPPPFPLCQAEGTVGLHFWRQWATKEPLAPGIDLVLINHCTIIHDFCQTVSLIYDAPVVKYG